MIEQLRENLRPTVLGYLKIGDKGGKNGAPRWFRDGMKLFLPDKDDAGQPKPDILLQDLCEQKYGKPLVRLPIVFLYNTVDGVFDASYQWRGKIEGRNVIICQGNGKKGLRLQYTRGQDGQAKLTRDPKGEPIKSEVACPCEYWNPDPDEDTKAHPCKWSMVLSFLLADFPKGGGYYLFRTHSVRSIRKIFFSITQLQHLTYSQISGIPVMLCWSQEKNVKNNMVPVVRLEWDMPPDAIRRKAIEQVRETTLLAKEIKEAEIIAQKYLTVESEEESEEVGQEFYPSQQSGPTPDLPKQAEEDPKPPVTEDDLPPDPQAAPNAIPQAAPIPAPAPAPTPANPMDMVKRNSRKAKPQESPNQAPPPEPPSKGATAPAPEAKPTKQTNFNLF